MSATRKHRHGGGPAPEKAAADAPPRPSNSQPSLSRPASPSPARMVSSSSSSIASVAAHPTSLAHQPQRGDRHPTAAKKAGTAPRMSTKPAKVKKSILKWICPRCQVDVRLPPPTSGGETKCDGGLNGLAKAAEDNGGDTGASLAEALDDTTVIFCALKTCPARRYHLRCSGIPKGSQIYRDAIVSHAVTANKNSEGKKCDVRQVLDLVYSSSEGLWWSPTSAIDGGKLRSHQSLHNDQNWSTSMESFLCRACDVEGSSRYLQEYFERFHAMKASFYEGYLGGGKKKHGAGDRLERPDESGEARTGEAFLMHLMKGSQQCPDDDKTMDWTPSEIQLETMERVLTFLSKQLHQQQMLQQRRRQKRQKTNFHLDPSYLVGMPVRLFNPIDNSYHSGRIVDYKLNAAYKVDQPIFTLKSDYTKPVTVDVGKLTDEKILNALFLVRFCNGAEGRKIAVHQWIYLEEHAVTVGGEICWAKVGDRPGGVKAGGAGSKLTSNLNGAQAVISNANVQSEEEIYVSQYRPVQIVFRSMLEMIPVQNLNSPLPCKGKKKEIPGLTVLATGFGQAFSHLRLSLSDSGVKSAKTKKSPGSVEPPRPDAIPLTTSNPVWIDRILHHAHLSDDDVAMGLASACMEKEEERRVRVWRHLSVSHLSEPTSSELASTATHDATPNTPVECENIPLKSERPKDDEVVSRKKRKVEDECDDGAGGGVGKAVDNLIHPHNTQWLMHHLKKRTNPSDPRPLFGCSWCGPKTKDTDDVCAACQLLKDAGWSFKYYEGARKKNFRSKSGEKICSVGQFLEATTDYVVANMKD